MNAGDLAIRPATPEDAARIAAVHVESIRTLGAAAYPPEVVAEWARPCVPERYLDQMHRGEAFFLALGTGAGEDVLGFSSYRLETGKHRTAVYVSGRAARRGVGPALFRVAEAAAIADGARAIHVNASLAAVEFYRAHGFQELGRGLHPLRSGRGAMACVFMAKSL
jgi:ribosomal protein S18 acetylase RimI-like enzyme